ncbi:DUF2254 domain-containing protein [Roseobacter sp. S98]|uniref:DUF2254 domain-containing protein n=1 Tax=Roseobacter algicola (ex Choi et al. 2025) (nom. illeg.) TaxID=3092138 RepID=UPI0035C7889C
MTRLKWLTLVFLRYYRSMGLRVFLYALLSIAATLISPFANALTGVRFSTEITFDSVTPVLTILATSMLAVSTFSLNIMVTAHRAAADTATPRMHRILLEDTTTQSVLSVFIGAFVYSLGSLVLYRLGFYPPDAALVVMGITTLVVVAVILSLLRWINHLTMLGSIQDSLRTAENRAREALKAHARHPGFGATPLTGETVLPVSTTPLAAPETGYLQLIDMAELQNCLPDQATLYLDVSPGQHVLEGEIIGQVSGTVDRATLDRLVRSFTFGAIRTHEQDAAFGLITLSEIASKALSPGINDSGTAIEALMILKGLLWHYGRAGRADEAPQAANVVAQFPGPPEFVQAAFAPIARDCAGNFDVSLRLVECLAALSASENEEVSSAVCDLAREALSYAEEAGMPERDLSRLRSVPFARDV